MIHDSYGIIKTNTWYPVYAYSNGGDPVRMDGYEIRFFSDKTKKVENSYPGSMRIIFIFIFFSCL